MYDYTRLIAILYTRFKLNLIIRDLFQRTNTSHMFMCTKDNNFKPKSEFKFGISQKKFSQKNRTYFIWKL